MYSGFVLLHGSTFIIIPKLFYKVPRNLWFNHNISSKNEFNRDNFTVFGVSAIFGRIDCRK